MKHWLMKVKQCQQFLRMTTMITISTTRPGAKSESALFAPTTPRVQKRKDLLLVSSMQLWHPSPLLQQTRSLLETCTKVKEEESTRSDSEQGFPKSENSHHNGFWPKMFLCIYRIAYKVYNNKIRITIVFMVITQCKVKKVCENFLLFHFTSRTRPEIWQVHIYFFVM